MVEVIFGPFWLWP